MRTLNLLSIVIPLYNEEKIFPELKQELINFTKILSHNFEIIIVDDGSTDSTLNLVKEWCESDPNIKLISFSRNFGHQIAISAGIAESKGDAVVVMDGDLQDPPNVIYEMIEKYHQGYDVVYAKRIKRGKESLFKKISATLFYLSMEKYFMHNFPKNIGDFRLMSRDVVNAFNLLKEKHRFVRGLIYWLGFKQTYVEFDRGNRCKGDTKYSISKMLSLGIDAVFSFSFKPLRLFIYGGLLVFTFSFSYALYALITHYTTNNTIPGWTSLILINIIFGSLMIIGIGIIGEYVGRIYEEQKGRPLYIIKNKINLD